MGNGSIQSSCSHALHKIVADCDKLMIYTAKSKAITKHKEKRCTAMEENTVELFFKNHTIIPNISRKRQNKGKRTDKMNRKQ